MQVTDTGSPDEPDADTRIDRQETLEWLQSLDDVIERGDDERVRRLLQALQDRAFRAGISLPFSATTPYINTIRRGDQPAFPGNREIERRIKSLVRWNAMAMVVRANRETSGIGGHISTYASAATLLEVGFNHFFKGKEHPDGADQIYFQGHASPGIYARAYLEGRISERQLENFRRELRPDGGLSSYPHPWLMSDFWEFPTVSMGLGPIMAIYQARFNRYLEDRDLLPAGKSGRVWAFLGDGELDEPESLGAISLGGRARLDNLVFVINCNLQRLDGPVRGNSKIIQEMEGVFRGAGWNVIKVIWGDAWDPLLEQDDDGVLVARMNETVDGTFQRYVVEPGSFIREHFFGADPRLLKMVESYTDDEIRKLRRGGHDPTKVYAAYRAAVTNTGTPTVILAKTIKGYGLGEAGEGKNITHQQKKLNEDELREFRSRFGIPISDRDVGQAPFYRPDDDSTEIAYMKERRKKLGGSLPERRVRAEPLPEPPRELFAEFDKGTGERDMATTMAFVRLLSRLLKDKSLGPLVVPIVPDEARTFGMESLFRQVGIYSHIGQNYEPVDRDTLLYYKEATDGQILEEGITEAGAMSSFIAAGTAYATHGVNSIPFFIFYSMFGFQRIGDLIWAAGDMRCRGFLLGATAGRTTLAGEGLQHQDGHSHLIAAAHPRVVSYDPAYAYELAAIVREGVRRMYVAQEDLMYYLTVGNETYPMPARLDDSDEGILKGMHRLRGRGEGGPVPKGKTAAGKTLPPVRLLGSGSLINETFKAADRLRDDHGIDSEVWSVTSWTELSRDAQAVARWNMRHPGETPRRSWIETCLAAGEDGVVVATTDYVKALPYALARWIPGRLLALGTDGFGRSDSRAALRDFFEVDDRHIVLATLCGLVDDGVLDADVVRQAMKDMEIDPDTPAPTER